MAKKALITGITGQDGSFLAELLLEKGYEVHGIVRRVALEDPFHRLKRIDHVKTKIKLHPGDLESYSRMLDIFDEVQPDECYHLAAQSFVHESFDDSFSTIATNINGTHHVLSALNKRSPKTKFYFAGSSEMFGKVREVPQDENTPFHPRSPYGVSKVTGFDLTRNYREAYGVFACSGILFNHESERRGFEFVTRKITSYVARIKNGQENVMTIGNLEAKRDWGYAKDYVEAMWLMLQQKSPDDYVVATGENHTIQEFLDAAFKAAGVNYQLIDCHGLSLAKADKKVEECKKQKGVFVIQHPRFYRPAEVNELLGDASKARKVLKWKPRTTFAELVKIMVDNDARLFA